MQTEKIKEMETNADLELERIIYEREMQRAKWLIKAYHRTRIQKIERHVQYYLHHAQYTARLSPAELEYAKSYFTLIGRYTAEVHNTPCWSFCNTAVAETVTLQARHSDDPEPVATWIPIFC